MLTPAEKLSLGIDTGGTFTDAVLYEQSTRRVLASAKALTTYHDLSIGILEAVRKVVSVGAENSGTTFELSKILNKIAFVGLSTTLATNALVEGRGAKVGLILIGYDLELLETFNLTEELGTRNFINVPGGHNEDGSERLPLDEKTARDGILRFLEDVDAFAVSGYFSVRNPVHELRIKEMIHELASLQGLHLPVTCGHELTSRLDSVRRAMTTVMNARLIPLLGELIETIRSSLYSMGIIAPLMVVRGDGSLIRAELAMERPIETILSGPAASVVGAQVLSGQSTYWMVDMGGTTTDIAYVSEGLPELNLVGAQVGKWRTMVEAIDLRTIGLGGDSRVRFPSIGPDRVVPLSLLATQYPSIMDELRAQEQGNPRSDLTGRFFLLRTIPSESVIKKDLSDRERLLVDLLRRGPISLERLSTHERLGYTLEKNIQHLVVLGIGIEGGFTPTDALHVLGELSLWNREAAQLGAKLQARILGISADSFCRKLLDLVPFLIAKELSLKALRAPSSPINRDSSTSEDSSVDSFLLERGLKKNTYSTESSENPDRPLLDCTLTLKDPIVAVGAPAATYLSNLSDRFHTPVLIPTFAEVANAIGAVAGLVVERVRVEIRRIQENETTLYRAYSPLGFVDRAELTDCIQEITPNLVDYVKIKASRAGAKDVVVQIKRKDLYGSSQGNEDDIYLGTELEFIGIGRPAPTRNYTFEMPR